MLKKEGKKKLVRCISCYLLSGILTLWGNGAAWGQGAEVVNIAMPDKEGISVNRSLSFSVPPKGLVLNNATAAAKTGLAGTVAANINLKGKAARSFCRRSPVKTNRSYRGL